MIMVNEVAFAIPSIIIIEPMTTLNILKNDQSFNNKDFTFSILQIFNAQK